MNNQLLWFVLASFATYRCASIVTSEDGPFRVFQILRDWTMANAIWLYRGIKCYACTSVWFGFFFAFIVAKNFKEWLILSFAISGMAILLYLTDLLISKKVS